MLRKSHGWGKRGDIAVTVFVILTIAVMIFALLSFSISRYFSFSTISEGYKVIEEFNVKFKNAKFNNEDTSKIEANKVLVTTQGNALWYYTFGPRSAPTTKTISIVEVRPWP